MSLALFGLLHLQEGESSAVNDAPKRFRDQVDVYVRDAVTLAKSLQARGLRFTLLTNRREALQAALRVARLKLDVETIAFTTPVPTGLKFFSAHYKLDAFRHLATRTEPYVGLCDLDMICIGTLPPRFASLVQHGIPACYDISDLVIPAYGHDVIRHDLQSIHGEPSQGRWLGGEFIAGPPWFFAELSRQVDALFPAYLRVVDKLHHVGDEAVTSAAIEALRREGRYVADAGTLGLVGRYWNADTKHVQAPFRDYEDRFLLHLPLDKRFLASLAVRNDVDHERFLRVYAAHRNAPQAKLKRALLRLRGAVQGR